MSGLEKSRWCSKCNSLVYGLVYLCEFSGILRVPVCIFATDYFIAYMAQCETTYHKKVSIDLTGCQMEEESKIPIYLLIFSSFLTKMFNK